MGIKAEDLRVGNLVYDNLGGILKMKGINSDSDFSHIKPIPLTEEWLIKFGFQQNVDKWFQINYFTDCKESTEKMAILINLVSNRCAVLDTDTDEQSAMTAHRIHYVHQLQNLYYALTNTELTIK